MPTSVKVGISEQVRPEGASNPTETPSADPSPICRRGVREMARDDVSGPTAIPVKSATAKRRRSRP
jgi:hypothetical protein